MLRVEIIKNVSDRYNITESYRKEYGDNVVMELFQVGWPLGSDVTVSCFLCPFAKPCHFASIQSRARSKNVTRRIEAAIVDEVLNEIHEKVSYRQCFNYYYKC